MEEVDNIILYHLRSLGCEIDINVSGLKQITTSAFVEATARCLHAIDSTIEVHYRLPPSMAAQFRVGANIATAVQNIGYRGDIGYHTFMYSSEAEMRKILLFLVDRLPKEQSEVKTSQYVDTETVLRRAISSEVARCCSSIWTPAFYKTEHCGTFIAFDSSNLVMPNDVQHFKVPVSKEETYYVADHLSYICVQPFHEYNVNASVLEANAVQCAAHQWNHQELPSALLVEKSSLTQKKTRLKQKLSSKLSVMMSLTNRRDFENLEEIATWHQKENECHLKRSRFVQVQHQQFAQTKPNALVEMSNSASLETVSDLDQKQTKNDSSALNEKLFELTAKSESFIVETRRTVHRIQQIFERLVDANNSIGVKEKAKTVKYQTVNLLPEADENLAKLEGMMNTNAKRLIALSMQWEKHRVPMVNQYRQLIHAMDADEIHKDRHMEDLFEQQEKMKGLITEIREKDALYKHLLSEYENMVKEVNRSAYTQRILEIVVNIRKQNQDIDKVLQDTKAVQKEINFLGGKLNRIFAVTDEIIFKDAKKDDSVRKAYKYLASLHENWSALINTVEETGVILKQVRDLEDQLDGDDKNKVTENLQKITTDHQQMLSENNVLLSRLT